MARPPTGHDALPRARQDLISAKTVEQLRAAQAVVLPLDYGLSLEDTGKILGRSREWVSRERRRYITGELNTSNVEAPRQRGGRRRSLLTEQQEIDYTKEAIIKTADSWRSVRHELRKILDERLPDIVSDSTLNRILARAAKQILPGALPYQLEWNAWKVSRRLQGRSKHWN